MESTLRLPGAGQRQARMTLRHLRKYLHMENRQAAFCCVTLQSEHRKETIDGLCEYNLHII
ncbi:rCG55302, isoform CRA_a [Rattus norvegicus]|uniref:RCG55302, isoform CRA_a n=1 Tax=Rattus norvegicus TaxID=10116 RepID=A6J825_RAT|nr:rCG55302, isoform CRA_a [Rattus norvegicus]